MTRPEQVQLSAGVKTITIDEIPNCSVSDRSILELVTDDDVNLEQLGGMIQENPSLTTLIIGLANSAFYGSPRPIYTIKEAIINVLGMQMVRSLVFSVILGKSLDLSKCPNFSAEDYWIDCLSAARFCQLLVGNSEFKRVVSSDEIYLCALLCGFGELVLVHHYPEEMNELIEACEGSLPLYVESQKELLGINHCEVGVLVGKRASLPDVVVNTMHYCLDFNYRGADWEVSAVVGDVLLQVSRARLGVTEFEFTEVTELLLKKSSENCDLEQLPVLRENLKDIAKQLLVQCH